MSLKIKILFNLNRIQFKLICACVFHFIPKHFIVYRKTQLWYTEIKLQKSKTLTAYSMFQAGAVYFVAYMVGILAEQNKIMLRFNITTNPVVVETTGFDWHAGDDSNTRPSGPQFNFDRFIVYLTVLFSVILSLRTNDFSGLSQNTVPFSFIVYYPIRGIFRGKYEWVYVPDSKFSFQLNAASNSSLTVISLYKSVCHFV